MLLRTFSLLEVHLSYLVYKNAWRGLFDQFLLLKRRSTFPLPLIHAWTHGAAWLLLQIRPKCSSSASHVPNILNGVARGSSGGGVETGTWPTEFPGGFKLGEMYFSPFYQSVIHHFTHLRGRQLYNNTVAVTYMGKRMKRTNRTVGV